jgi:peroxin-14
MLDQLVADTEALKAAEQSRVERVDGALKEMEAVVAELKTSSARREDEARRLGRDVDVLRDLIERGLNAHKDIADRRLAEVNTELKGLKTLVASRMTAALAKPALPGGDPSSSSSSSSAGQSGSALDLAGVKERLTAYKRADETPSAGDPTPTVPTTTTMTGTAGTMGSASENASGESRKDEHEAAGADDHRRTGFSSTRLPVVMNRAAIPAWQMAAAVKKAPSNVDNAG